MRALAILALMVFAAAARAEELITTLSDDAIEITSNFTGEQIVVFGAVDDLPPGAGKLDVAIVVRGPPQDLVVRRKERILGIWTNRTSRDLHDVPTYYVMHLSPGFAAADLEALDRYRLGLERLEFVREAGAGTTYRSFAEAVIDLKERRGLFVERADEVVFLAPNVFRTTFFLPSVIPTGQYRVSVYLFRDGAFVAGRTQPLNIAKSGYSDRIARFSDEHALAYGLACVVLAVFTGWLAGLIFRRP